MVSTRSNSGEFAIVSARQVSPLARSLAVKTNLALVTLEPALLAVSAEHIRDSVYQELGIDDINWRGQVFLALRPARSLDEDVTIVSSRFNNAWMYRVELPDVVSRARLTHALAAVILLEYANRTAGDHSAEVPGWLAEGVSQQLLESVSPEIVSIGPGQAVNGYAESRIVANDFSMGRLTLAHMVLKNTEPLTVEQLSWPTDKQLSGADGGVYRASAQLFLSDLLALKGGPADVRAMLQALPQFYNWQLAFHAAFQAQFPSSLDVDKWWALQSVDFISRDAGPQWSPEISRVKMDEILAVPMDFRSASNNLPLRAEISLQNAINNVEAQRQVAILQQKVRELDLAQLQMAPQFAVLNEQYRRALADYLNEDPAASVSRWIKHPPARPGSRKTIERLDALDAQRRALENALDGVAQPALTENSPHL
ncbi:MAG TPA: hypothetical protein VGN23_16785 [Verrucomicrobiae bacterium]